MVSHALLRFYVVSPLVLIVCPVRLCVRMLCIDLLVGVHPSACPSWLLMYRQDGVDSLLFVLFLRAVIIMRVFLLVFVLGQIREHLEAVLEEHGRFKRMLAQAEQDSREALEYQIEENRALTEDNLALKKQNALLSDTVVAQEQEGKRLKEQLTRTKQNFEDSEDQVTSLTAQLQTLQQRLKTAQEDHEEELHLQEQTLQNQIRTLRDENDNLSLYRFVPLSLPLRVKPVLPSFGEWTTRILMCCGWAFAAMSCKIRSML